MNRVLCYYPVDNSTENTPRKKRKMHEKVTACLMCPWNKDASMAEWSRFERVVRSQ